MHYVCANMMTLMDSDNIYWQCVVTVMPLTPLVTGTVCLDFVEK